MIDTLYSKAILLVSFKTMPMPLLILFLALSFFAGCSSGPIRDFRVGKSFAVLIPSDVPIFTAPHPKAEKFHLQEAESFVVEELVCKAGISRGVCLSGFKKAHDNRSYTGAMYFKVRFESGREGYFSDKNFLPKLSLSITSEERAKLLGTTPEEYAKNLRGSKALQNEIVLEGEEARRKEEERLQAIEYNPWSEAEKKRLRVREVWTGMDSGQLESSKGSPKMINRSEVSGAIIERWYYDDFVYYIKDETVIKWDRVGGDLLMKQ